MVVAAAMSASMLTGCQGIQPTWPKTWGNIWGNTSPKLHESKYPAPVKMAAIWTPAVYNQVGQPTTRGLGGRIYFYDAKNQPVAVEGQLVVYAYNDTHSDGPSKTPERKFAFTPEQFTQHYNPTELGASYSVWIPWDAVGQPQMDLSLVPIFTSSGGQLVIGETSHNLLPGPKTPAGNSQTARSTLLPAPLVAPGPHLGGASSGYPPFDPNLADSQKAYAVQQTSFETPPDGAPPQETGGLPTMSINLTGSMADQLAAAPPQMSPTQRLAVQRALLMTGRAAAAANPAPNIAATSITAPKASFPGAAPPTWMATVPQPARFAPPSPQAPTAPALPPAGGPPLSQPFPAAPQFAPPGSR
jgi:hypothetical protein